MGLMLGLGLGLMLGVGMGLMLGVGLVRLGVWKETRRGAKPVVKMMKVGGGMVKKERKRRLVWAGLLFAR